MTAVEYLVTEPRAVARDHGLVRAKTRAARSRQAVVVVFVVVRMSDGACRRYL